MLMLFQGMSTLPLLPSTLRFVLYFVTLLFLDQDQNLRLIFFFLNETNTLFEKQTNSKLIFLLLLQHSMQFIDSCPATFKGDVNYQPPSDGKWLKNQDALKEVDMNTNEGQIEVSKESSGTA